MCLIPFVILPYRRPLPEAEAAPGQPNGVAELIEDVAIPSTEEPQPNEHEVEGRQEVGLSREVREELRKDRHSQS